jgi:hypothetical protein
MPLLKPRKGEKKADFITRCMGDAGMKKEFSDNDQRLAVCYRQFEGKKDAAASAKLLLPGNLLSRELAMEVSNVRFHDTSFKAESSPFGDLGYAPDRWKGYMEFDICHSLPAVLGPVMEGFYCAYTPSSLAMSHASLLHQQVNLGHLLKTYGKEEGREVSKDRIVGCVVATFFPDEPEGGWQVDMSSSPNAAPCIRACAVIFKLADGVNRVVGDHQTSREKQSVSIEAITTYDNLGVLLPSRGVDSIQPLLSMTDPDLIEAFQPDPFKLNKINGEQPVFMYGIGRPVDLRGVGITPRPAEAEAKIVSFNAAKNKRKIEGGTLIAMAASQVDQELSGRAIKFNSGRSGLIREVHTEGKPRVGGLSMPASADEPVLEIELPDKARVLRRLSDVQSQIA